METMNPVQLGPPRLLRLVHPIVNDQMFVVGPSYPVMGHYWMIERLAITMQAESASSTMPPLCNFYHAPAGVIEDGATGKLLGINLIDDGPQGSDMVLCDATLFSINGTVNIGPFFLIADETHPIYIPENRVPVLYIGGYSLTNAKGYVQCEIQYTDWLIDVPKAYHNIEQNPEPKGTD